MMSVKTVVDYSNKVFDDKVNEVLKTIDREGQTVIGVSYQFGAAGSFNQYTALVVYQGSTIEGLNKI